MTNNPQELIHQVLQATDRMSDQEAAQRYQQILAQLPPEQAAELNALALSQVSAPERRTLAGQFRQAHNNPNTPFDGYHFDDEEEAASPLGLGRMSARAQQQDPALVGGLLGGNSQLGGAIGKAALGALAALLIRQLMSRQQSGHAQGGPAGGLGGLGGAGVDPIGAILGGLLGGGLGGQQLPGGFGGGQNAPSGGFGGQQFPGGFGGGQNAPSGGFGGQQLPGGLDLGSILSSVLGSGSMARQAPQGGGLGSLLGSILGGLNDSGSNSHRR